MKICWCKEHIWGLAKSGNKALRSHIWARWGLMRRLGSSRGSAHFSLSQGPDNSIAPPHRSYYTLPHQGHAWKYICKFMKIFSLIPTGHIQQMCKFPRPRCEISNLTPCLLRIPYLNADTAKSVIAGFSFANTQMISFQAASS